MTRYDAVNFIAHGVSKNPNFGENKNEDNMDEQSLENDKKDSEKESALSKYCINLNEKSKEGQIDPLIGRSIEVERCIQILCRRRKPTLATNGGAFSNKCSRFADGARR